MPTKPMSRVTKRKFGPNIQKFKSGEAIIQQEMLFKEVEILKNFLSKQSIKQNKIDRIISRFGVKSFQAINRMKNSEFFNGKASNTELIKIRKDLEDTYEK